MCAECLIGPFPMPLLMGGGHGTFPLTAMAKCLHAMWQSGLNQGPVTQAPNFGLQQLLTWTLCLTYCNKRGIPMQPSTHRSDEDEVGEGKTYHHDLTW
jgi:hypothetical protein